MLRQKILQILSRRAGFYVSGEEMSRELKVTRAAVWKAVAALREAGYEISSVTNRGYRLDGVPDLLSAEAIRIKYDTRTVGQDLIFLESVDSTNTYAKSLALSGAADGTVILAEEQTGGRGRMGRSFQSSKGKGVYLTAIFLPQAEPAAMLTLTARVAVAVCDAVEDACGVRPQIKWTNDILMSEKKLCGILTEMGIEGESGRLQYVVAGMGINVGHRREDFDEAVRPVATSLFLQLGKTVSRAELAAKLISRLDGMYAELLAGSRDYLERYRKDCITVGRRVRVIRGESVRPAFALGIGEDASLLVRYEDGSTEDLIAGEVTVRGSEGYI
ncbi:biotin--[acetyl-CoA-carboxylase] ligase [Papillibacter cinnamivorans]|uniref:Bifunctional ligase/repressor BirA n=1 Tax=Papillibacter cinnamivorans DSM 12816 TaxID=1122930 RepID=A0A1W2A388_9FIRM|nr:biotin--[acetyl-CoA-carboxylase] ligase [Papillibacter cinnamivorans]SMC55096.1 BirA family transcriptional regulator, biotin operon repressor / biotin-[acetyl-CoA-carboxylase] ligase [Papillibacter cinnamivorans DSM 12816]